ncbi:hypothetical protein E2C01_045798 [Portunus trituberculatus]|uniref:Uncharacterized protein n=1 Tax=Portunus trituberculatus TaxID=210409 RepID=A0A5B7FW35_PORTR|nr:hypothetical protein [Portunus trituberculatus]
MTTAQNQRKHMGHHVKPFWETVVTNNSDDRVSVEDKRVTKLRSENIVQVDGYYQLLVSFHNKNPGLPDNKAR